MKKKKKKPEIGNLIFLLVGFSHGEGAACPVIMLHHFRMLSEVSLISWYVEFDISTNIDQMSK